MLKSQEKVEIQICRNEGSDGQISCTILTEALVDQKNAGCAAIEFEDYIPRHEKVVFQNGENSKIIEIALVNEKVPQISDKNKMMKIDEDDESRDEIEELDEVLDVIFKVKIEKAEPEGVKISKKNVCFVTIVQNDEAHKQEDEQIRLLKYFVESKEPTWLQQFSLAVQLGPVIDSDNLIVDEVSLMEALTHFATVGWKVLFSLVPPAKMGGGIPAFIIALSFIGIVTAIVGEVATVLGCVIGLKSSVTAITIVAIGTSLPDTFASKVAAQTSKYADSAVGNVTGSNSVNVFLGLGLPWVIAATWSKNNDMKYVVPAGSLAFSVMLFLITSTICFIILILRRCIIGGELGGPPVSKYISAVILVCLWLIYVSFSAINAYGGFD